MISKDRYKLALNNFYSKEMLVEIYEKYLIKLISEGFIGLNLGLFEVALIDKNTKKEFYLSLLEELYSKKCFQHFIDYIDENLKKIFLHVLWYGEYEITKEERAIFFNLTNSSTYQEKLKAEFAFFKIVKKTTHSFFIDLDYDIKRVIRLNLNNFPKNYYLNEVNDIKSNYHMCNEYEFLHNFNKYLDFFKENKIALASNNKILKESKKNLQKFCKITEFYPEEKNLEFIKSETISLFFILMFDDKIKKIEKFSSIEDYKNLALDFLQANFKSSVSYPFSSFFLNYLKGVKNIWNNTENSKKVFYSLFSLLQEMKDKKTISVNNFIEAFLYRDENIELISTKDIKDYVYINEANLQRTKILDFNSYIQLIIEPMVKAYLFILTTIGLLDITYLKPSDKSGLYLKNNFLSQYDGIETIKLSNFGLYVLGKYKKYDLIKENEKEEIYLDDKNLLITVVGEQAIFRSFLENISTRISNNIYKIDEDSFCKKIKTKEEYVETLKKFKEEIKNPLTKNWEDFFDDISEKFNSISIEQDYIVLKLDPKSPLMNVILKDSNLKKLYLKAENYHIIISKENFKIFKEILQTYGYYIN